jgi:ubiquinone/menaquinone biosynthesis C-methylase UbiE
LNEKKGNGNFYGEWYFNRPDAKKYLSTSKIWVNLADMIATFQPNRIFEFGSGLGNLVAEVSKRGYDIVGSEISEYALSHNLAPEKVMRIGLIPEDNLPFPDNSFDLVFSSEVLEHIPLQITDAVISELYRVCSKHILLTINTFDAKQPGHINMHSHKWWVKRFSENGFSENKKLTKKMKKMRFIGWDVFVFDKERTPPETKRSLFSLFSKIRCCDGTG